jgi:hypothetical protein
MQISDTKALPSGRKVKLIEAKGRHYVEAKRLVGGNVNDLEVALASVVLREVDSAGEEKKVLMEDMLEWSLQDFIEAIGLVSSSFLSLPQTS